MNDDTKRAWTSFVGKEGEKKVVDVSMSQSGDEFMPLPIIHDSREGRQNAPLLQDDLY
jgi:hypothetical protein